MAEISDEIKNKIVNLCTPDAMTDFVAHVGRGGGVGIGVGIIGGKLAPLAGVTPLVGAMQGLPTGMIDGARTEALRIFEGNTTDAYCVANTMQRQSHGSITPSDKITAIRQCAEGTEHNLWVNGVVGAGEGATVGAAIGSRFSSVGTTIGALSGALFGFGTGMANAEVENYFGETTKASCVADTLQEASKKPEPPPLCRYPGDPYHRPYIAPCPTR